MDTLTIYFDENKSRYFIGKEIAAILGYKNTSVFLRKISDYEKTTFSNFTGEKIPKQDPRTILVAEIGVYHGIQTVKNLSSSAIEVLTKYQLYNAEEGQYNDERELTMYSYISNHLCFEYFIGFEIVTLLGYKNITKTIDSVSKCNKLLFKDYPGVRFPPLDPKAILLTRDGVIEILLKTRKLISPDVAHILKKFGIDIINKKCFTKEQNTLSEIAKVFKIENIETQFPVGKYFLDMYLSEYKIIVECDELGHFDRDPAEEKDRVDYINTFLDIDDTHWVRFNPDKADFDISKVIGEIYMTISRLREGKIIRKTCCTCKQEKLSTEFHKSKDTADGYGKRCIKCQTDITAKISLSRGLPPITLTEKECRKCKEIKPIDSFHLSKIRKDGHCTICKNCDSEGRKKRKTIQKEIPPYKKCSGCEEVKKSCDFFALSTSIDGLNGRCKECMKKRTSQWIVKSHIRLSEKECKKCATVKNINDFYTNTQSRDGHYSKCKECMKNKG